MLKKDLVIVGGGALGMFTAINAAEQGFDVALIEAKHRFEFPPLQGEPSGQTIALNWASQQMLEAAGVWQHCQAERIGFTQHMHVWDTAFDAKIHFAAEELSLPCLSVIIEQKNLLRGLSIRCQQLSNIECLGAQSIEFFDSTQHNVSVSLPGKRLTAKLLIAADGSRSLIREQLGLLQQETSYDQSALISILATEHSHQHTAWQSFSASGPMALLPLADHNRVSLVWSLGAHQALQMQQKNQVDFERQLRIHSENVLGHLSVLEPVVSIPLNATHATQYFKNRCVLVGDSAHRIHPLAGQGANLGFQDVKALVQALCKARTKGRDIGHDATLMRYQQARWLPNQLMLRAMTAFKKGFASQLPAAVWGRGVGLNWVDNNPSLKQFFADVAIGQKELV